MKIAIQGCAHGELENIYNTIAILEKKEQVKIDLLLCCGDFQTSRNEEDLRCMAVPPKYYNLCSFYKYYSGEKLAPILTILIGGNHEASNYLQELPYGGWVAPRIYYLGYAGVIEVAGIRIGGLSGIYKGRDYTKGHFEVIPYNENTKRSVYHIRNLEVFRLKQLTNSTKSLDIFLSHDWPTNVTDYGNKEQLIRFKPHFQNDIENKKLGSEPCEELLKLLKPKYWFSAHLHCKFAALIPHNDEKSTKFLALDKCLPKRRFLQILDIPHEESEEIKLKYDLEWLTILVLTNHLLSVKNVSNYMPGPHGNERYCFTPSDDEKSLILSKLNNDLTVPENFIQTAKPHQMNTPNKFVKQPGQPLKNPQTVRLCELLNIDDPIQLILENSGGNFSHNESSLIENLDDSRTFIEDSLVDQSKNSTLNLPEPKNDANDLFFIDTNPSEENSRTKTKNSFSLNLPPPKNEVPDEQLLKDEEKISIKRSSDEVIEKIDSSQSESGNKKVFKRRNLSLYKDEDDLN